jgi:O-antigen/teichoic acid export membrane protein
MTGGPAAQPLAQPLNVRAARGTAAAFTSQALKLALHVGLTITLARLLTPEAFGLFGIAFAVTGFLEFAKDGGLIVPVVQRESLEPEQLATLFWVSAGIGVLVTLLTMLAAPLVGRLFSDARLVPITLALSLVFLAGGLSTQHSALLRRQLRFTALASCELAALALASVVAVASAARGAGYWALVYFQLVREVVQTVLIIAATRWLPRWPTRWAAIGDLVRFGGQMMLFDLLGYFNFKADNVIVGWALGPTALGLYDKAYQLLLLPVNQIGLPLSGVVHATLSRLQREPDRYRVYLGRAVLLSTGLGMPLTLFLYANAHTVVEQLLGPRWLSAVPIFQALTPAALCMSITACVGWIFLSLGRVSRQLPWATATTLVTVVAFLVGTRWGTTGVALAFSVSRVLLLVPTLMFTCAGTPVTWTDILRWTWRPVLGGLAGLAASLAMDRALPVGAWTLPRNAIVFALAYGLVWVIEPGGRRILRENLQLTRLLYQHP